jgi:PhnB protein
MHVSLPVGKGNVLMGTDVVGDMAKDFIAGNDFSLSINADNKEEADTLFTALSAGGTVIVPIDNSPWGSYFGMLTDKFGIKWMVDLQLS